MPPDCRGNRLTKTLLWLIVGRRSVSLAHDRTHWSSEPRRTAPLCRSGAPEGENLLPRKTDWCATQSGAHRSLCVISLFCGIYREFRILFAVAKLRFPAQCRRTLRFVVKFPAKRTGNSPSHNRDLILAKQGKSRPRTGNRCAPGHRKGHLQVGFGLIS